MASDWMPIETAPKDGTTVLVARHVGNGWGWVIGVAEWSIAGDIAGWISRGLLHPPGELGLAHPTHWMPLPEPPESVGLTITDHPEADDE